MEAIGQGIPVIVSTGFNLSNMVKDNNLGLVVDYQYQKSAKKIIKYLSNHESILKTSKSNIAFSSKEFDPPKNAQENIDFYQEAIK
jgi:glycosyltransferase involved in cell wall biosynthesis